MLKRFSMTKTKNAGLVCGCKMLVLAALLSGTAASRADVAKHDALPSDQEAVVVAQQRISTILAGDANAPEMQGEQCLPSRRIRSVDVLDGRTLIFDLGRDRNYLVRLNRQCFGLRRNTPISYEITGGRLCRLDGIRALENWGVNRLVPGPRCSIPSFIAINDIERSVVEDRIAADKAAKVAQLKADKAARKAAKRAEREAKENAKTAA